MEKNVENYLMNQHGGKCLNIVVLKSIFINKYVLLLDRWEYSPSYYVNMKVIFDLKSSEFVNIHLVSLGRMSEQGKEVEMFYYVKSFHKAAH